MNFEDIFFLCLYLGINFELLDVKQQTYTVYLCVSVYILTHLLTVNCGFTICAVLRVFLIVNCTVGIGMRNVPRTAFIIIIDLCQNLNLKLIYI
jgi:hypothetical protein